MKTFFNVHVLKQREKEKWGGGAGIGYPSKPYSDTYTHTCLKLKYYTIQKAQIKQIFFFFAATR